MYHDVEIPKSRPGDYTKMREWLLSNVGQPQLDYTDSILTKDKCWRFCHHSSKDAYGVRFVYVVRFFDAKAALLFKLTWG